MVGMSEILPTSIIIYFRERPHTSPRVYNAGQHLSIYLLFTGPSDHSHYEVLLPLTRDDFLVPSIDNVGMSTQISQPPDHNDVTSPCNYPLPDKHVQQHFKTHSNERTDSVEEFQFTICSKSFRLF